MACEITTKRSRQEQHTLSKRLYVLRSRLGRFIGRRKAYRRVAPR